jgi:arylsulfatase A-like enzyme
MTSRREFLLGGAALPALAQKKAAPRPPNIVLVIADDLPAWMLGCYGNKEIHTPNIDRLAQTGARLANNYVCTPICSASRATLFTGRTPMQHGIHDFLTASPVEKPPQGQAAPPASFAQEVMISDVLAGAGYNCGYTGKWHMGSDAQPQHQFKYWYTLGAARGYRDPHMSLNGKPVDEKGYLADLITQRACEFIGQQNASQPFFLTVSHLNPHVPYEGHPQKYYDMYAKTKFDSVDYQAAAPNALREKEMLKDTLGNIRRAAAATTALDDQLPLMECLRKRGVLDNTVVVFTGDNGFLLGRHGLWSKGLASDPINMFEEVMAVPMIWSWPSRIPPTSVRPEMTSFYDVMPTMCEIAGAALPNRNLCGRSYFRVLSGQPLPKKQPWPSTVFGSFRNTEMARDNRHKVIVRNNGEGPNELYDMIADRRERMNQYENPAFVTVRDRLSGQLAGWKKRFSS